MSDADPRNALRLGVVFENTVGHVTFAHMLHTVMSRQPDVQATFFPISVPARGVVDRLQLMERNWSLHASLHTRAIFLRRARELDALLFHTQTATLLSVGVMHRIPSLVSLDATPLNFDEVGEGYGHRAGSAAAEAFKLALVRRPLRAAHGLIAWSDWVRRSLIEDYAVDPRRIEVIPAGTDPDRHTPRAGRRRPGPARILFVGGAFERKGGLVLLAALDRLSLPHEVDVVTQDSVEPRPGVRVHRHLRPGDREIDRLYADADVFALPTTADASPHVVLEAMAAGLPVITTRVGAIPEVVRDGESGLLVEVGDVEGLTRALERLCAQPDLAREMGNRARARALADFNAHHNVERVLTVMRRVAAEPAHGRARPAGARYPQ